jgi:cell division protein FtsB
MLRMRKQLTIELQQNELLKKRNQALMQQVQGLKNNNEAVEARARHELGMIKKGETFYQVVK